MISKSLLQVTLVFSSTITSLFAQSHTSGSPLDKYVEQASEFSSRARANVYFPNPQSIFAGVQFNFVNVGSGNLTFLRRDMVASGRIPLVFARVYDSASAGTPDFGPGWRLTAAETISFGDDQAHLATESGSVIDFVQIRDGSFQLRQDYPSDYLTLVSTAKDTFKASLRNGLKKEFKLIGDLFRLTRVTDRNGNEVRLIYAGGRLARIENVNHYIAIMRNKDGRIALVQDDQGRKVEFLYDNKARLIEVDDLGGHTWKYEYGDGGKLVRATDPLRRLNFAAVFEGAGRVQRLQLPSGVISYSYDPGNRLTTVIDRKRLTSRFFQNEDGITTRVVNALGEETAIGLDSGRNVTSLARNGSIVETMQYDQQHRLLSRQTVTDQGTVDRHYNYDPATGLLAGIQTSTGQKQAFSYDANGNLSSAALADGQHTFSYSPAGDLNGFSTEATTLRFVLDSDGLMATMMDQNKAVTSLQYKAGGQLESASFPNHTQAKYEYQPSGLRSKLVYKDGRRVEYSYDPAGNLTGTKVFNRKGEQVNGQTLEMDDSYQLVRWMLFDGTETSFQYDPNGNLTAIKKGKSITRFEYDSLDRLTTVITPEGQRLTYTYKPGERSLIEQHQHGNVAVEDLRDTGFTFARQGQVTATRPVTGMMGSVRFAESLGAFQISNGDGSEISLPHENLEAALKKQMLFDASIPEKALLSGFNIPFNTLFMPGEYLTINCCPECYYDSEEGGWYCPPCFPPPPPDEASVSAGQLIKDSLQANFSITVTSGNATSYMWSFTAPSGAGNAPHVTFTSASAAQTSTDGHWFALPNDPCSAQGTSTYTITGQVTFDDGVVMNLPTALGIDGVWDPAGVTDPSIANVTGFPSMAADGSGVWRVTGMGNLTRVVPTTSTIFVIPTSQFFQKTVQHEQVHVNQWVAGPGHLFGDLFDPNVFFSQIQSLTGSSQADLTNKIESARTTFFNSQATLHNARHNQAEHEAYAVSDPINPQYVYQNCGRF